jgi:hypothetical protein
VGQVIGFQYRIVENLRGTVIVSFHCAYAIQAPLLHESSTARGVATVKVKLALGRQAQAMPLKPVKNSPRSGYVFRHGWRLAESVLDFVF